MFRLWIERRFSRPVTAAGAVLKPQDGNCAVLPKLYKCVFHPRTLLVTDKTIAFFVGAGSLTPLLPCPNTNKNQQGPIPG